MHNSGVLCEKLGLSGKVVMKGVMHDLDVRGRPQCLYRLDHFGLVAQGGRVKPKRLDKADDAGKPAGPLTNYLASLAPAGLSPFKGQKSG